MGKTFSFRFEDSKIFPGTKKWDEKDETGLRFSSGVLNVEYYRDIKPIFERSCVACQGNDHQLFRRRELLKEFSIVENKR